MIVFQGPIHFNTSTFHREHSVRAAGNCQPLQAHDIGRQDSCPKPRPGARTGCSEARGARAPYLASHSPGPRQNVRTRQFGD
jgi:hypothetical protein